MIVNALRLGAHRHPHQMVGWTTPHPRPLRNCNSWSSNAFSRYLGPVDCFLRVRQRRPGASSKTRAPTGPRPLRPGRDRTPALRSPGLDRRADTVLVKQGPQCLCRLRIAKSCGSVCLVGAAGFEPTTCSTQNCHATSLLYTPIRPCDEGDEEEG